MKLQLAGVVMLAMLPLAQAQVTVYGNIGLGWRHADHVDPAGSSRSEIGIVNTNVGVLGIRGEERLSPDLQLHFKLENGFFPDTGAQRNAGLFGREAYVGLTGPWGTVDIGRTQYAGNAAEPLVRVDPAHGVGPTESVWPGIWTGARWDASLRYRYEAGPWLFGAMHAFGAVNRMSAVTMGYRQQPLLILGVSQEMRDASSLRSRVDTLGATYDFPGLSLHGAWLHATRDKGFVVGATTGTGLFNTDLGFPAIKAPANLETDIWLAGVSIPLAQRWRLRGAGSHGRSPHATMFSAVQGGSQRSAYLILDYTFSKRTSVLASTDYNNWDGGWSRFWGASPAAMAAYKLDGRNTRRTVSLGMQHLF